MKEQQLELSFPSRQESREWKRTPRTSRSSYPYKKYSAKRAMAAVQSLLAAGEWVSCFEIFSRIGMRPQDLTHGILFEAVEQGLLEEKHCYYGSDRPGDNNYQGYWSAYRLQVGQRPQ